MNLVFFLFFCFFLIYEVTCKKNACILHIEYLRVVDLYVKHKLEVLHNLVSAIRD